MISPPDRPRAAAAVFRAHRKEILLVKHRWRDGTTSWILPGGALLPGEKPEEAALRELQEETGLNVDTSPLESRGILLSTTRLAHTPRREGE